MALTFSVIIPCYNQAQWLSDAVDSALAQTPKPEVIVVNDGSTDETASVTAQYGSSIIVIHQLNAGLPAARNAGILQASGDVLVFLDSDDSLGPDFIARASEAFRAHPWVDVLHGRADVVNLNGQKVASFGGRELGCDPFGFLVGGNDGPPNTWIIRRTLFASAGLFDTALTSCEDWDMWLRCALVGGRFLTDTSIVAVYRDVPGSMSKQVERMWHTSRQIVRRYSNVRGRSDDRVSSARGLSRSARQHRAALTNQIRNGKLAATAFLLLRNPTLAWAILRTVGQS